MLVLKGGESMPQKRGKGWFGDSEGHSKAGRKGGLARSSKAGNNSSNSRRGENSNM
jgi:hypothetical protein